MVILFYRKLANSNHYPAIDDWLVLVRVMPNIVTEEHLGLSNNIKDLMAVYKEAEDLINNGAYKKAQTRKLIQLLT